MIMNTTPEQRNELINGQVSSRNLQILFLKSNKEKKVMIRNVVYEVNQFSAYGSKLKELVDKYFGG